MEGNPQPAPRDILLLEYTWSELLGQVASTTLRHRGRGCIEDKGCAAGQRCRWFAASWRSPSDLAEGDRQPRSWEQHRSIQGAAGCCGRQQDACQEIRDVLKGTPSLKHCFPNQFGTGVLLCFQDRQSRQPRNLNSNQASLLQGYCHPWPDTQLNTKARRFPVNYGTAAFSRLLLALVTPSTQDFCTEFLPLKYHKKTSCN